MSPEKLLKGFTKVEVDPFMIRDKEYTSVFTCDDMELLQRTVDQLVDTDISYHTVILHSSPRMDRPYAYVPGRYADDIDGMLREHINEGTTVLAGFDRNPRELVDRLTYIMKDRVPADELIFRVAKGYHLVMGLAESVGSTVLADISIDGGEIYAWMKRDGCTVTKRSLNSYAIALAFDE